MVLESERLTFNHVLVAHTIGGAIVGVLLAPGRVELLGAAAARRAGRSRRRRAAPGARARRIRRRARRS